MKLTEVEHHQNLPVQGGIYADQGSMGEFKVLAVGSRDRSAAFAVQSGPRIMLFPLGWWKILFPKAKLLRVVDPGEPRKGEGEFLDGRMYELLVFNGTIQLNSRPQEEDQPCKQSTH